MTKCIVTLHRRGFDPFQSARAWFLRTKSKLPWKDVRNQVHTVNGQLPGQRALENAVAVVAAHKRCLPSLKYANCGRTSVLSREQQRRIVAFVKKWKSKRAHKCALAPYACSGLSSNECVRVCMYCVCKRVYVHACDVRNTMGNTHVPFPPLQRKHDSADSTPRTPALCFPQFRAESFLWYGDSSM